jgi:beta-glucosidase
MRINTIMLLMTLFIAFKVQAQEMPWLNPELDIETRASALVAAMTLEEKITQSADNSPAILRLKVPAYRWWSEALHGVARSAPATVFPQAIGLGATFDPILLQKIGDAVGQEGRAIHNQVVKNNKESIAYMGLTFWSPNVNIFRDPRWGRGQETYGEDPFLTGTLGAAFIRGMQGSNPDYLQVAACAKHFAVHSGPEELRHGFNAIASKKDLWETYLPAFKSCVDTGVEAVMCAYNRTNDEACCGSNLLLQDILLNQWGFKGHVVSDCWAINNFHNKHQLTPDVSHSAALAVKRGVNLECGSSYGEGLKSAIEKGLVTEKQLDDRLKHLLKTRFKLGAFDPAELNPYRALGTEVICSPEKRELALNAARNSIVLLKNDKTLPLNKNSGFIYLTGPLADSIQPLVGNYNGINSDMVTILEGVAGKISSSTSIQYRQGALLNSPNLNKMDWFSGLARDADATIVVLGLTLLMEGEEGESIASPNIGDNLSMQLPESQLTLLRKINKEARAGNSKVVTVVCAGSPLDLREVERLSDAVLYAWYPGECGGQAVAEILFGDVSPSGKLPITFPMSADQLPDFKDYSMEGRTYKYMTKSPMYPFGYGLGYADLKWKEPKVNTKTIAPKEELAVTLQIENKSAIDAQEVVQLYISITNDQERLPIASLKDFKRVSVKKQEIQEVKFLVPYKAFSYINSKGQEVQHQGKAILTIANASPGQRSKELAAASFPIEITVK